jgi:hypothetical protein
MALSLPIDAFVSSAPSRTKQEYVYKTLLLNQHSVRQLLRVPPNKHVYVDIHIPSPGKWLVITTSPFADYYGFSMFDTLTGFKLQRLDQWGKNLLATSVKSNILTANCL